MQTLETKTRLRMWRRRSLEMEEVRRWKSRTAASAAERMESAVDIASEVSSGVLEGSGGLVDRRRWGPGAV